MRASALYSGPNLGLEGTLSAEGSLAKLELLVSPLQLCRMQATQKLAVKPPTSQRGGDNSLMITVDAAGA